MSDDLVKREFLIFKAGRGWYRPDSQGYTPFKFNAGRYTEKEAISITHPNGEDGPRDGMYYRHESQVRDDPSKSIEELEAERDDLQRRLASYEEMAREATKPGLLHKRIRERRLQVRAEQAEAKLAKAVEALDEAHTSMMNSCDAEAFRILDVALAELKGNKDQ